MQGSNAAVRSKNNIAVIKCTAYSITLRYTNAYISIYLACRFSERISFCARHYNGTIIIPLPIGTSFFRIFFQML